MMQMTSEEIRKSYTTAKYKDEQIGILADLNACDIRLIKDILAVEGVDVAPAKVKRSGRHKVDDPVKIAARMKAIEARIKELTKQINRLQCTRARLRNDYRNFAAQLAEKDG